MFGSFFSGFFSLPSLHYAFLLMLVSAFVKQCIWDFSLMQLVLIDLVNCQSLNFTMIAGFLLYLFSCDLFALSILSGITVSSTVDITLLIYLVKMFLLSFGTILVFWVGKYFWKLWFHLDSYSSYFQYLALLL